MIPPTGPIGVRSSEPSFNSEADLAAAREVAGQLRNLVLRADHPAAVRYVPLAELVYAQLSDDRVTSAKMDAACQRAERAQQLIPARQSNLLGYTYLLDEKFALDARAVECLAEQCPRDALLAAIDSGPPANNATAGKVAWKAPGTRAELVASLVRQLVLGGGASLQFQLSQELETWLHQTLSQGNIDRRTAMGGASAFCANLGAALPKVTCTFFARGDLPGRIADHFHAGVQVAGATGDVRAVRESGNHSQPPRVNYCAEYRVGEPFAVHGLDRLSFSGVVKELRTSGESSSGRVIMGTTADLEPGFSGVSREVLESFARGHDLFFCVGVHYYTRDARCGEKTAALAQDLDTMKRANPSLLRHLQYVVPKNPAHEGTLFAELRGHVDSMSLNAVEVPALLERLCAAGLSDWAGPIATERDHQESSAYMLATARALREALGLQRLHVHGMYGDLILESTPKDPERTVLAAMRARQILSNKCANRSGEIRSEVDMWAVQPVVEGKGLLAVEEFADAVELELGLSSKVRERIAGRWYHDDGATAAYFVPGRGLHDFTGGTTSAGDTIDFSTLVFSRAPPDLPGVHRPHER